MKHKHLPKTLLALVALVFAFLGNVKQADAQSITPLEVSDFSAILPDGQTMYYNIDATNNLYVWLTAPFPSVNNYWYEYPKPTGNLELVGTVTHGNITYTVIGIENHAFEDCTGITSVTIPSTFTSIGSTAFNGCGNITSVVINSNAIASADYEEYDNLTTRFGDQVRSYTFGGNVTRIGAYALKSNWSNITSISLPNTLTYIGDRAFIGCKISSLTIPSSVDYIGECAFLACAYLTSVTFVNPHGQIRSDAFANCIRLNQVNLVASTDFMALRSWCEVTFANEYANPLTTAHNLYVNGTHLTSLNLPGQEGFVQIKPYVFSGGNFENVSFPSSVQIVGHDAFLNCTGLTRVIVDNMVSWCSIDFADATANPLTYAHSIWTTPSGGSLYMLANDGNWTTPSNVYLIGRYVFSGWTDLHNLTIGANVETIESNAFEGCTNLTSVNITDLTAWCNIDFADNTANPVAKAHHLYLNNNEITAMEIPNTVTAIKPWAFTGCTSFTSVTIPNGVTSIGNGAFAGCNQMATLTISNSVSTIGNNAFNNCYGLTEMFVSRATPATIGGAYAFTSVPTAIPVHVPLGSVTAYQAAPYWSRFTNLVADQSILPTSVTVSDVNYHTAKVSWTRELTSLTQWDVCVCLASTTTPPAAQIHHVNDVLYYNVVGLEDGTMYKAWVRYNDGNVTSDWVTSEAFSTIAAVTPPYTQEFANTSIPEGWRSYLGSLEGSSSPYTATLTPESGRWHFGAANGVFNDSRHAWVNIGGYLHHFWLISPLVQLDANANMLSFDLALTLPTGNMVPIIPDEQLYTRIFVLVSADDGATWTKLQAWKERNTAYSDLDDLMPEGATMTYNIADYAGQNVLIGFYMECTDADDASNRIHIDNFSIESFDPTLPPTSVTVSHVAGHSALVSWTSASPAQDQWDVFVVEANSVIPQNSWAPDFDFQQYTGQGFCFYEQVIGSNQKLMTGLESNTYYKAYVRYNDGTTTSEWVNNGSLFHTVSACAMPTDVAAIELTPTSALITWTPGQANQTSWVTYLHYVDQGDVPVNDPYRLLQNLQPNHSYEFDVRGECQDGDGNSNWVHFDFTTPDYPTLTVSDGNEWSSDVVIQAVNLEYNESLSQFVIPAEQLSDMQYSTIRKLQFYCDKNYTEWHNEGFIVYLKEVDFNNVDYYCQRGNFYDWNEMTQFYNGTLSVDNHIMTITPVDDEDVFEYQNGNLLVGIYQDTQDSNTQDPQFAWAGVNTTANVALVPEDHDIPGCGNFLPKTTFTFEPSPYLPPTNLVVYLTAPDQVTLTWTMREGQAATDVQLLDEDMEPIGTWTWGMGNIFGLGNLNPDTDYNVRIRARYGTSPNWQYSAWTPAVPFHTPDYCAAPANLQVDEVGPFTATITWDNTAEYDEVEYRELATQWEEGFEGLSGDGLPSGWTKFYNGDGQNTGGWWNYGELNGVLPHSGDRQMRSSGFPSFQTDDWLILPQMELGGVLKLWACTTRGTQQSFSVYVSVTGTNIADFGTTPVMTGSPLSYQEFIIDLSGFEGLGYVAIRHQHEASTVTSTLAIDDVTYLNGGNWTSLGTVEGGQYDLEGLTPGATYQARVRALCENNYYGYWSDPVSFTTVNNIVFADAAVKTLCVQNWDTNNDGELSYTEAAVVQSLGTVFKNNQVITSFNELQYFTSLTVINDRAFAGCANLQEITLPASIITIEEYAFGYGVDALGYPIGCTSLHNIVLPEGLATIGSYAFSRSGLESLDLPNSVTTIGQAAFDCCTSLTSIYLPASVTTFTGSNPFDGCDLSCIKVDSDNPVFDSRSDCNAIIQTTTNKLVTGCKNTFIPEGVTSIGASAFENATDLTTINLPSSLESIGVCAFMNCSGLTAIYANYAPPTIQSNSFANIELFNVTVYVPCVSVENYQDYNNTGQPWGGFANIVGEDCQITYNLASGWNWWAPFESNIVDELMQAFDNGSIVGDILINTQDEGFARRTNGTWGGTLTSIEPGKMYKVLTEESGSLTFNGELPTSVTVELQPGYTWFGFIGTDGTDIATLLTPVDGDQLIRLINGTYTTYTYSESDQVWTDGTYNVSNLLLQRGRGYIYYNSTNETKTITLNY